MASAERIERERVEKRVRVLDAARTLFVERGVEAVTLREIAQRIEYSTTAIYVHFKDKAALVDAMVSEDFAAFAHSLERCAVIVDAVERICALHDAYIEFALAWPRHYQLLFLTPPSGVHGKPPTVVEPAGIEGYRVLHAAVAECLRTHRLHVELTDADAVAQVVWAAVHGLVSLLIVMGSHAAFRWRGREALARTQLGLVLRGILRDPSTAPSPPRARRRAGKKPRAK